MKLEYAEWKPLFEALADDELERFLTGDTWVRTIDINASVPREHYRRKPKPMEAWAVRYPNGEFVTCSLLNSYSPEQRAVAVHLVEERPLLERIEKMRGAVREAIACINVDDERLHIRELSEKLREALNA